VARTATAAASTNTAAALRALPS